MTNVNLKENRFETDIEKYLITQGGYEKGSMDGYNYDFAINGKELVAFLEETQPLSNKHGNTVSNMMTKWIPDCFRRDQSSIS